MSSSAEVITGGRRDELDFELMGLRLLCCLQSDSFDKGRLKIVLPSELLATTVALRELAFRVRGGLAVGEDVWGAEYRRAVARLFDTSIEILPGLRAEAASYISGDMVTIRPVSEYVSLTKDDGAFTALAVEGHHFLSGRPLVERGVGLALLLAAAHYVENFRHTAPDLDYLRDNVIRTLAECASDGHGHGYALALYKDLAYVSRSFAQDSEVNRTPN